MEDYQPRGILGNTLPVERVPDSSFYLVNCPLVHTDADRTLQWKQTNNKIAFLLMPNSVIRIAQYR